MNSRETERIAICCVLLDVMGDMEAKISLEDCRHYSSLKEKAGFTDRDLEAAHTVSVLSSLVVLKGMHYNLKMLLALTICDAYSACITISLTHRIAFETLMNAIDWPISFSEILTISRSE